MGSAKLHGIVPPLPTPMVPGGEDLDIDALIDLVNFHLKAGVHGLWVLGTTARFDLLTHQNQRLVAEAVARQAAGHVPLVLNVSEQGTARTLENARRFDDLPYDYYAALPPWYFPMTPAEVSDYFRSLADQLKRPLVIYNAPWVCNQLSWEALQKLAEHPRIVGCKDVCPTLGRPLSWTPQEREALNFSYLHGSDLIALSTALGSDGFVSALSDIVPALAVAIWEAGCDGNHERANRLQVQFSQLGRAQTFGPGHSCLDAAGRHLGLFQSMLPRPLRPLDPPAAKRVAELFEAVGHLPEPVASRKAKAATV